MHPASHFFRHALVVALAIGVTTSAHAQRCAGSPTYAPIRISVGGHWEAARDGHSEGWLARLSLGRTVAGVRFDRLTARSFAEFYQYNYEYQHYAGDLEVRTTEAFVRRAVPVRDGQAALCLSAEYSHTSPDFVWPSGFERSFSDIDGVTLGVGYSFPVQLPRQVNSSMLFEWRLQNLFYGDPHLTDSHSRAVLHEFSISAGVDLPGPLELNSRVSMPFFDPLGTLPTMWKTPRVPVLRVGLVAHFDWRGV